VHASCTSPKHENEGAMVLKAVSHPSPLIITQPTAERERETERERERERERM